MKNFFPGWSCHHPWPWLSREEGAAVLLVILLLASGISLAFMHALSASRILTATEQRTAAALNLAREALLGYAVTYPDQINPDYGPGYLPCPDRNNDGITDAGSCSLAGRTSIGRFPYKTLELEQLRDGYGETLWYVVADNFRNNPKLEPLNSDVAGNLGVDSINDIAALVIAPGAPTENQNRILGLNTVENYLEGENADFDEWFTAGNSGGTNDRLAFITRRELMQAVEKRVLGEVVRRLHQYQDNYHAFPWLSPYQNPMLSVFQARLDKSVTPARGWQGHIAFHPFAWSTKPSRTSGVNPFTTIIRWSWGNIVNANITASGTVNAGCLAHLDCDDGIFPQVPTLTSAVPVSCIWTDRAAVDCAPLTVMHTTSYLLPAAAGCAEGTLVRTYVLNFPPYTGTFTVHEPTATTYRSRGVMLTGTLPERGEAVRITDLYSGPLSGACEQGTAVVGTGVMSFGAGTTGTLKADGLHYDLDIKAGEMPEWFFKNDWHAHIYIAYAGSETLPGAAVSVCDIATTCLVLDGAGAPERRGRALALIAGPVLEGRTRPGAGLESYFESANAVFDENFVKGPITSSFNDQVRVIATP